MPLTGGRVVVSSMSCLLLGVECSGEDRGDGGDAVAGGGRNRGEAGDEFGVDHAGAEIGPAQRLVLLALERPALARREAPAGRRLERVEVERGLRA